MADDPRDSTPPGTTQDLARGARDGDSARFTELYERLMPVLHSWAALRIRDRFRGRLEPGDVIQEVWMRAHGIFDRWDETKVPFRAWILAIAKNVMLEAMRKLRRPDAAIGTGDADSKVLGMSQVPDDVTAMSRKLIRDERLSEFVTAVKELPEEDRLLVVRCGLEGDTCARVARSLDLGEAAVIKRWQRLRSRLEERGVPDRLLS